MKYPNSLAFVLTCLLFFATLSAKAQHCNEQTKTDCTQKQKAGLIIADDFDKDMSNWIVEQMPGGKTFIQNGQLEIDDSSGCTVWLKKKLEGPIIIEYKATLIDSGGKNDRVSDLNCFWMAIDPQSPENIFMNSTKRGGKFANYHNLRLYYVGYGANTNTTTRFRRYPGDGTRPMLPEYDLTDSAYMHIPNQTRLIRIVADKNKIQYCCDNITVFDFYDDEPFLEGWFGFRTVKNHMKIDDFKVYRILDGKGL